MMQTPEDMLSRVQLMAAGDSGTWDLSDNDIDALRFVLGQLDDARRERDAANKALDMAKQFIEWAFEHSVIAAGDLDGGSVQDELEGLGMLDAKPTEAGSPEADDWGEGTILYYLKPEWKAARAAEGGEK